MKKAIIIALLLPLTSLVAQVAKVLKVVDGVTYEVHGLNGTTFLADGSIDFVGGIIVEPLSAELETILRANDTTCNDLIPANGVSCSTTQVWFPTNIYGGGFWMAIYGNLCGPVTYLGTARNYSNSSGDLCSAKMRVFGMYDMYSNDFCGF